MIRGAAEIFRSVTAVFDPTDLAWISTATLTLLLPPTLPPFSSSTWKRRNTSFFWGVQIQRCPLKFKPEYLNQNKIHIKWGCSSNLMENSSKQKVAGSEQQGSWRAPQHSPVQSAGQGHLSWTRCAREGEGASSAEHKAHRKEPWVLPAGIKEWAKSGIPAAGGSRRCQLLLPASEAGTPWWMGDMRDA